MLQRIDSDEILQYPSKFKHQYKVFQYHNKY